MTSTANGEGAVPKVESAPSLPSGCKRCGAPARDTDFACTACGGSFVGDPALLATRPTIWSTPYALPEGFVLAERSQECAAAKRALYMALAGIFCFGFGFGLAAIRAGFAARAEIARTPGMKGSMTATIAILLGAIDIFGTVLFLSRLHNYR